MTKFDLKLTLEGTKNPNFDLIVRMAKDQFHYKDYQIPFPMTIHGPKSELKQLRYLENTEKCVSMLLEAITFDLTSEFSISLVF